MARRVAVAAEPAATWRVQPQPAIFPHVNAEGIIGHIQTGAEFDAFSFPHIEKHIHCIGFGILKKLNFENSLDFES